MGTNLHEKRKIYSHTRFDYAKCPNVSMLFYLDILKTIIMPSSVWRLLSFSTQLFPCLFMTGSIWDGLRVFETVCGLIQPNIVCLQGGKRVPKESEALGIS